jgi:hypothetical protein
MNRIFFALLLMLLIQCTESTPVNKPVVPPADTKAVIAPVAKENPPPRECECVDTAVVDEQTHKPPFSTSSKIISYEFKDKVMKYRPIYENIISGGVLQRKEIVKEINITKRKNALERILLNKTLHCYSDSARMDDCMYQPRHCIVFYDSAGKATDFIEICFFCDKVMTSPGKRFGPFCGDTFCELRTLFKNAGHELNALSLYMCPDMAVK